MSETLAPTPRHRNGPPLTLESEAVLHVRAAGVHEAAGPAASNPEVVVLATPDGGVVVYPPSQKLAILALERRKRAEAKMQSAKIQTEDADPA